MLRLFVLCAILTLVESHLCDLLCKDRHNPEPELKTIEQELTDREETFQKFCKENLSNNAKEMYGTDSYHLKYDLPEAKTSKVTVQINHKFIHTTVTRKDGDHEKLFKDVKFLPEIANAEAATWSLLNNKVLDIVIPYKVPLGTEVAKDCGAIHTDVIDVPFVLIPEFKYRRNSDLPTEKNL